MPVVYAIDEIPCHKCEESLLVEDARRGEDDKLYCEVCYDEDYSTCHNCGDAVRIEDARATNDKLFCEGCYDDLFVSCNNCGETTPQDYSYTGPDGCSYCEGCSESFSSCSQCCEPVWTNDLLYSERNEEYYCEGCYPGDNEGLYTFEGKAELSGTGHKIGVEIEVKDQDSPSHSDIESDGVWSACEDGSQGVAIEYTSPILRESNYKSEIERFCGEYLPHAEVGSGCGLHIHLDCSEISWSEIALFFQYCKLYEDWFYSLVPSSRRENHFAERIPNLPTPKRKVDLVKFLYGNLKKSQRRYKYPNCDGGVIQRYFWVNIHSYFYRRTIEIRLHSGTTSAEKINRWVELFLAVLKNAIKGRKYWRHPADLLTVEAREYFESRQRKFS